MVPNAKCEEKIRLGYLTPAFSGGPYVTLEFSGVSNPKCEEQNRKCLPHPYLLGGPKEGGTTTQPLHSRGSPTPSARKKTELPASPRPSQRPKRGRNCYVTHAFSGVPNAKRGEKIRIGYLPLTFSGA